MSRVKISGPVFSLYKYDFQLMKKNKMRARSFTERLLLDTAVYVVSGTYKVFSSMSISLHIDLYIWAIYVVDFF